MYGCFGTIIMFIIMFDIYTFWFWKSSIYKNYTTAIKYGFYIRREKLYIQFLREESIFKLWIEYYLYLLY